MLLGVANNFYMSMYASTNSSYILYENVRFLT